MMVLCLTRDSYNTIIVPIKNSTLVSLKKAKGYFQPSIHIHSIHKYSPAQNPFATNPIFLSSDDTKPISSLFPCLLFFYCHVCCILVYISILTQIQPLPLPSYTDYISIHVYSSFSKFFCIY